tara:strand:- start:1330 stop:2583 length:1254 start_codon:yes stop_codon:yes gene_type:complete
MAGGNRNFGQPGQGGQATPPKSLKPRIVTFSGKPEEYRMWRDTFKGNMELINAWFIFEANAQGGSITKANLSDDMKRIYIQAETSLHGSLTGGNGQATKVIYALPREATVREKWLALENAYDRKEEGAAHLKFDELINLKQRDGESVMDYTNRALNIQKEIIERGGDMSDRNTLNFIIRGALPKLETIVTSIKTLEINNIYTAINKMRDYEDELNSRGEPSTKRTNPSNTVAYDAQVEPNKASRKCYVCQKKGHFAKECWQNKGKDKGEVKCFNCEKRGHISRNCPNRRGERGRGRGGKNRNRRGEQGHVATGDIEMFYMASEESSLNAAVECPFPILDSGATSHMTGASNILSDVKVVDKIVHVGNGEQLRCNKMGEARLIGRTTGLCLHDMLEVEGLRPSYLSPSSLTRSTRYDS